MVVILIRNHKRSKTNAIISTCSIHIGPTVTQLTRTISR